MGKETSFRKTEEHFQSDNAGELLALGGSKNDIWNHLIFNQISGALWAGKGDPAYLEKLMQAAVGALADIRPDDPIEGMIISQMIAAQSAVMECYRRAMLPDQSFEGRQANLSHAGKLSRAFGGLVEALNRHRGKSSQQTVIVKRVTVEAGAQAVVGTISTREVGRIQNREDQPHAKSNADASIEALRCQDTTGRLMPIASHVKRSVPYARRQKPRRATG